MNRKKIEVCLSVICCLLILTACSNKKPNNSGPPLTAENIQGTWYLSSSVREIYITTNKDQVALDIQGRSPGTGSLTVTGAYNVSLNRLAYLQGYIINASSHGYDATVYPNYQFGIINLLVRGASFTANLDENNAIVFNFAGTDIDSFYQFDTTSYSLTVNNMVLQNNDQTASVTVNGNVTTAQISITGNIQTRILYFEDNDPDSVILILNADSTSLAIDVTAGDTTTGTWSLYGNTLTTTDDQVPPDTTAWTVSYYGATITVVRDSTHCETAPCDYSGIEINYNLESGTVTDAMTRIQYTFSR